MLRGSAGSSPRAESSSGRDERSLGEVSSSTLFRLQGEPAQMIHVENLVKTFGEVKAVDGISFDVAASEIFAFLGPNGAGKTTTIQMLTTLQRPTSGSMRLDGPDPGRTPR